MMSVLTQHFRFLPFNPFIPTFTLTPLLSKAQLCLINAISVNFSQMKKEGDLRRGKLEHINLDCLKN